VNRRLARFFPLLIAAGPVLVPSLSACGGGQTESAVAPDAKAELEVRNQGFADMTIYAISATGGRVRLGMVSGNSTQRLALPSYLVRGGQSLRFLADPIGGNQSPVTEQLLVAPGETVVLTIPPR
jgi:hypothetical protein